MAQGPNDTQLPITGRPATELWAAMDDARTEDVRWREGRVAALVYLPGDDVTAVARDAYMRFFSENGLSARAFPSLARFESDVIAMTRNLLHGTTAVGSMTSGGTESIILALKIARDRARVMQPGIMNPEIVVPETAHPAFDKGAHLLGLEVVRVPVGDDFRVDMDVFASAVTEQTVLLAGSAPNYPYGMVDPIPEMADLAAERDISFHVDACVGGFFLPFLDLESQPKMLWDFRVPGVTTISADLHKYGFAARGASVILSRDEEIHQFQGAQFDAWPSGSYQTQTLAGSRPGGAIAAAWAVMQYLGESGYRRLTQQAMRATRALIEGVEEIPGFTVFGQPDASVLAFGSPDYDMPSVAAGLEQRGWFVHSQRTPPGIHVMLSPGHEAFIATYLNDLHAVLSELRRGELYGLEHKSTYN